MNTRFASALILTGSLLGLVRPLPATAYPTYTLSRTMVLNSDILNFGTDGVNLLVLDNELTGSDRVRVYSPTGTLLHDFSTGSAYTAGITSDGTSYIFGLFERGFSDPRLYRMDSAGTITGPFGSILSPYPTGLSFDGTHLLMAPYATSMGAPGGNLTVPINRVDPASYAITGSISLTTETGTALSSTPVYGIARHDGDYFVSYQFVNRIYRFDATGAVVQQIPIDTTSCRGIAFIGDELFVADRSAEKIYVYAVPEPATMTLLAFGGLVLFRRRSSSGHHG